MTSIQPIPFFGPIKVHEELRTKFRFGMWREWYAQYRDRLFDAHDEYCLAAGDDKPERRGFFFEWLSAIRIFEARGYYSLQKYEYAPPLALIRKRPTLQRTAPEAFEFMIEEQKKRNWRGWPDLFVFKPDFTEWFLVEVKGADDDYGEGQEAWFERIAAATKARIYLMTYEWDRDPVPPLSVA
jgi:hypothetical protein